MEERDKHKLEGLLQARSEDMRQRRRPRQPQSGSDAAWERARAGAARRDGLATVRHCSDCGGEIAARRVRALPRADRCLDCQREFEQAGSGA